jgi:hypothetical protein
MSEENRVTDQAITRYASLLNAAHLLAEESDLRLQELAARYPDTFPPEILGRARAGALCGAARQAAADTAQELQPHAPA